MTDEIELFGDQEVRWYQVAARAFFCLIVVKMSLQPHQSSIVMYLNYHRSVIHHVRSLV